VRRLKQRRRGSGSVSPRPIPGGRPKLDGAAKAALASFVKEKPDATLEELRARVASELGVRVSVGTLWQTLRRMEFTFKKSRRTPPNSPGPTCGSGARGGTTG
jgi:transposase